VRKVLHGVRIADCPPELREKLAQYDTNGNGIIDPDELPDPMSAEMTYLKVSSFPKKVHPLLHEIDDEKNGKIEMDELTEILTVYSDLKRASKEGSIAISNLPKEMQHTLKTFDVDGDGTVGLTELARAADLYEKEKQSNKNLKRLMIGVILACIMFCSVMLGLMLAANEASKDSKPASSGKLKTISGKDVAVAASTYEYKDWELPLAPVESLREIKDYAVTVDGKHYQYTITGFEWHSEKKMQLFSARGDVINIDDGEVFIEKADGSIVVVSSQEEQDPAARATLADATGRRLLFNGALMTSGSFTMMAASGGGYSPPPPPKKKMACNMGIAASADLFDWCLAYSLGLRERPLCVLNSFACVPVVPAQFATCGELYTGDGSAAEACILGTDHKVQLYRPVQTACGSIAVPLGNKAERGFGAASGNTATVTTLSPPEVEARCDKEWDAWDGNGFPPTCKYKENPADIGSNQYYSKSSETWAGYSFGRDCQAPGWLNSFSPDRYGNDFPTQMPSGDPPPKWTEICKEAHAEFVQWYKERYQEYYDCLEQMRVDARNKKFMSMASIMDRRHLLFTGGNMLKDIEAKTAAACGTKPTFPRKGSSDLIWGKVCENTCIGIAAEEAIEETTGGAIKMPRVHEEAVSVEYASNFTWRGRCGTQMCNRQACYGNGPWKNKPE